CGIFHPYPYGIIIFHPVFLLGFLPGFLLVFYLVFLLGCFTGFSAGLLQNFSPSGRGNAGAPFHSPACRAQVFIK
ncbi:MAG: hypothetical protein MSH32_03460, partial [Lachnospiraceae bacterium]|nr:hypothetical protein [Lachnospiraceae bacterium]